MAGFSTILSALKLARPGSRHDAATATAAETTRTHFQTPDQTAKCVVIALAMMVLPTSALAATFYFTPCGSHQNCSQSASLANASRRRRQIRDAACAAQDRCCCCQPRQSGGNLVAEINIGRIIRAKGYETFVANGRQCASACGLIWLAGVRRLGERNARNRLRHAAFIYRANRYGYAVEKGMGNALVGAYLNELGGLHLSARLARHRQRGDRVGPFAASAHGSFWHEVEYRTVLLMAVVE